MKALKGFSIILLIILLFLLVFLCAMCYNVYNQIKTETIPTVQEETFIGYETNIFNSLIESREIEIPSEILTGLANDNSEKDVVVTISEENTFELWFSNELPILGEVDILLELEEISYDIESGLFQLKILNIYLGTYKLNEFFYTCFDEDSIEEFSNDKVSISEGIVEFEIENFEIELLGVTLEIGVDSIRIEEQKVYAGIYSDVSFDWDDVFTW